MPRCWGCRAPHYPMGSALCSRISCRKPPGSPRFFTSVFDPFGAAFWRHGPVSPRFWPLWCCVLAAHARLPSFSGPCGAARCGDECMPVLGHARCPGESIWSSYGRCAKSWTVPDRRIDVWANKMHKSASLTGLDSSLFGGTTITELVRGDREGQPQIQGQPFPL